MDENELDLAIAVFRVGTHIDKEEVKVYVYIVFLLFYEATCIIVTG